MTTYRNGSALCRLKRLALLLAGLFVAAIALAGTASAHATLVDSNPDDGARLQHAPKTVTVTFDESVGLGSLGYLHVTDSAGRSVDAAPAYHPAGKGNVVADPLRADLPDGTYLASYRVISADSHPVAGVVRFVVGDGVLSDVAGVGGSSSDAAIAAAMDVSRWISYAGFALLGGAWLVLTVWPQGRDDRRACALIWTGWGAAFAGAVLEVLLQGPLAAGSGFGSVFDGSLLDATLHTSFGTFHSARLLLLGGLALLFGATLGAGQRSGYEPAYWPLVAGTALTFSATGHAATTGPVPLSVLLDVVHLAAMAAWVGGLVLVLVAVLPREEPAELAAAVPVFSRVAFWSVVVLALSGTWAAWHGVGRLDALFTTEYGLLVAGKIVLFVGLVALGNVSRTVVQSRWGRSVAYAMPAGEVEAPPVERLRRSVLVEVAIAAIVLALTSVLVGQPRGREALAVEERRPVTATAALGSGQSATVTLSPGVHGTVAASVTLTGGSPPQSVAATATLPARRLGPIPLGLRRDGTDLFSAARVWLPAAGAWRIDLTVNRSQFDAVTADVVLTLH